MTTRFVNEKEAAEALGVAVRTMQQWRFYGQGPIYHKFGRSVRYRPEDLEAYAQKHRVEPFRAA